MTKIQHIENMKQVTTPATNPGAGFNYMYFKNNDEPYLKTSAGVERKIDTSSTTRIESGPVIYKSYGRNITEIGVAMIDILNDGTYLYDAHKDVISKLDLSTQTYINSWSNVGFNISRVSIDSGFLYLFTSDNYVWRIDTSTMLDTGSIPITSLANYENTICTDNTYLYILVTGTSNQIRKYNKTTMAFISQHTVAATGCAGLVYGSGFLYCIGVNDVLYKIDVATMGVSSSLTVHNHSYLFIAGKYVIIGSSNFYYFVELDGFTYYGSNVNFFTGSTFYTPYVNSTSYNGYFMFRHSNGPIMVYLQDVVSGLLLGPQFGMPGAYTGTIIGSDLYCKGSSGISLVNLVNYI